MTRDLALPERGRPTPGPWRIYGPQPDTLGGRHLTILAGTGKARFGVADIRIIDPNDALEASANANLIAAAPDGYEAGEQAIAALNAMMDAWFDYHDAHSLTQAVTGAAGNAFDKALAAREKLEAFTAKARGEPA